MDFDNHGGRAGGVPPKIRTPEYSTLHANQLPLKQTLK